MNKFTDIKVGSVVKVEKLLSTGYVRERMLALGLTQDVYIEVIRKGPKDNLTIYNIRGAMIALRKDNQYVVADATSLERNFNLLFQIMELTDKVILCINLIDEAKKKGIYIYKEKLEKELNIPVVLTAARSKVGIDELLGTIEKVSSNKYRHQNQTIKYNEKIDRIITSKVFGLPLMILCLIGVLWNV